ncbi:MAG TPA: peptidase M48 [Spirochaetia bacterium]|nr:peptidase M48 [Spirochaetia bacterium]
MELTVFRIITGILVFNYLAELVLGFLNHNSWNPVLPEKLKDIYSEEKYRKAMEYDKANYITGILSGAFGFILIMCMLIFRGFAFADSLVRQYTQNPVLMSLAFFGGLAFLSDLLNIPFDLYETFVIEEKFGFNRTTAKTWIFDKIKGWMLALIMGGGLLALLTWFYQIAGNLLWIYAWLLVSAVSLFLVMFYSSLIVPLFNKQTPLPAGDLRNAIEQYAVQTGFKIDNIFVIDGSKRSSKANAYFSGLGPKKRIVLFDTLIKEHSAEEIVSILAHEIGHYKKKHTIRGLALSILENGVMFYLFGLFIGNPLLTLGAEQPSFHMGILIFSLLYSPVSSVLHVITNYISRRHEYQADRFAAKTYQAAPLIIALKKLSVNNLSNLTPHPAYVFVHYSHPPLLKRLEQLDNF